jgi:hypothetical protein
VDFRLLEVQAGGRRGLSDDRGDGQDPLSAYARKFDIGFHNHCHFELAEKSYSAAFF